MQHLGAVDKVVDLFHKVVQEDCLRQAEAQVPIRAQEAVVYYSSQSWALEFFYLII